MAEPECGRNVLWPNWSVDETSRKLQNLEQILKRCPRQSKYSAEIILCAASYNALNIIRHSNMTVSVPANKRKTVSEIAPELLF